MTIYVIDDWDSFKDAVAGCRYKLYQIRKIDDVVIVKARAGSIGFEKVFNLSDPKQREEYDKIVREIEFWNFTEVKKVVNDDEFFI